MRQTDTAAKSDQSEIQLKHMVTGVTAQTGFIFRFSLLPIINSACLYFELKVIMFNDLVIHEIFQGFVLFFV